MGWLGYTGSCALAFLLAACGDATGATPLYASTPREVPSAWPDPVSDEPWDNQQASEDDASTDGGPTPDAADAGTNGGVDAGYQADGGVPPPLTKFDESFGTDGRVLIPAPAGFRKFVPPRGCLIGSNGTITLGGSVVDAAGTRTGTLVRVRDDGAPDPAFGANGIVAENFGMPFGVVAAALTETAGGALRIFGHAVDDDHGFFVAQRATSGAADAGFGTNGLWRTAVDVETMRDGASVVLQLPGAANDLVVGGWYGDSSSRAAATWKFSLSPIFSLAPGFGVAGSRASVVPAGAHRAAVRAGVIQSSGAIVLSGEYQTGGSPTFHAFVVRLLPSGQLDTTFGSGGWALVDNAVESSAAALALLQDDGLFVAGYQRGALSLEPTLWRLSEDGIPDTTFGSAGRLIVPFGQDAGYVSDIWLDHDNRILVAATLSKGGRDKLGAARIAISGALDPTFLGTGFFIEDAAVSAFASRIAADGSGRVIVAGALSSGELLLRRLREFPNSP